MFKLSRQSLGLVLIPIASATLWFAPLHLESRAQHLLAVFAAVAISWIAEILPIAITSLLIGPLMVLAGITDAQNAMAPYADPIIFLFIGGFFLAKAMTLHGLDKRVAATVLNFPLARNSRDGLIIAFIGTTAFLSMWMSNSATCAMMLPIYLGAVSLQENNAHQNRRIGHGAIAIAYACSVGGMGTLVGTPPNAITSRLLGQAGADVGFLKWMMIAMPIVIAMMIALWLIARGEWPEMSRSETSQAPWSRAERITAFAFGAAIFGWFLPGLLDVFHAPIAGDVKRMFPEGLVAILVTAPLFALRVSPGSERSVLPWSEGLKIDWGLIFLFGGGLSLGNQMIETGLAAALGRWLTHVGGFTSIPVLCAILIVTTVALSEVCSNTATANILVPLAIAASGALGVNPELAGLSVGLAASGGFMLPIATGPNAIVWGTGRVTFAQMVGFGWKMNVLTAFAIWLWLVLIY